MKKKLLLGILMLAMSFSVFACGKDTSNTADNTDAEDTATDEEGVIKVSSAEEFLEAIAPGAVIEWSKGSYDMTPEIIAIVEENSKWNKKHDYVKIEECFDGFEIIISDVDDLTIRGAGKSKDKVELMVEPRYADVLSFANCSNITIENMTIGHTIEQGSCAGDVLQFDACENITLNELDLYGCGTYGINAMESSNITTTNSIIRDCSYGIMSVINCDGLTFESCEMYGCDGFEMIDVYSSYITMKKCAITDNACLEYGLVSGSYDSEVAFKGCTFGENESLWAQCGDNTLEGVVSYDSKCVFADLPDDAFVGPEPDYSDYTDALSYDEFGSFVSVSSIEEMLDNIAPDTYIYIEPGYYNMTEYLDSIDVEAFNENHEYVSIEEEYDGYEIIISNCDYLAIDGESEEGTDRVNSGNSCEIVVEPRYAAVLTYEKCSNVYLNGLTLGHTNTGDCSGNVVDFINTSDILISDCDLYGCGVYAIGLEKGGNLTVTNSYIHDCSFGPCDFYYADGDVWFYNCDIAYSSGGFAMGSNVTAYFYDCSFGQYESYSVNNERHLIADENCVFADYEDLYED